MDTIADPPPIPRTPLRRRSSAVPVATDDGGDSCRICRGEGIAEQPLFYPCKCSGSIKYVHQDCLMEWLSHSQKKYCELCKTPFRFTKLYDHSMPEHVPWLLFGRQVALHAFRAIGRWSRYIIVTFIWMCWLPWTIRNIWRALFWIADGSWLTRSEMEIAVQQYAIHMSDESAASIPMAITNSTLGFTGTTSFGFFSTMMALVGVLDPQMLLRTVFKLVLRVAIWPTMQGDLFEWDKAFLFTPIPRPPSLLSDFHSITSATRFPILNNAVIDVLEGQLVCLTIVAIFILVFLIREWVINQQPLLNMPEDEQANDAAPIPAANDDRRAGRRRARGHRQHGNDILRLENRPRLPARPRVRHAPRRRATENNILVHGQGIHGDRPAAPQRAQSLIPGLQALEDNVRQLGELQDSTIIANLAEQAGSSALMQEQGQNVNNMENLGREGRHVPQDVFAAPTSIEDTYSTVAQLDSDEEVPPLATPPSEFESVPTTDPGFVSSPATLFTGEAPAQLELTFRSGQYTPEPDSVETDDLRESQYNADQELESDSGADVAHTPQASSGTGEATKPSEVLTPHGTDQDTESAEGTDADDDDGATDAAVPLEPDDLWTRLSKWLWHTDEYLPGEPPAIDADETEIIADIDAQAPFVPVHNEEPAVNDDVIPPAAPEILPNVQQGLHANNPNAVDEAEDLEGILELIGMEGPIAGMIQNIIFSVFLITLTLSASVWCPYIWGKITLLFLAHPFNVFIRTPLFLLSRTADFIVDVGLLCIGLSGLLLNSLVKVLKLATIPLVPQFSKRLNTALLDQLSSTLSQNSSARLERSITRTLLGFRPDLPTFSIQAHHVLRVFSKNLKGFSFQLVVHFYSLGLETADSFSWHSMFTLPVKLGPLLRLAPTSARSLFTTFRQWLRQLQYDLRPISFTDPEAIDYSLVQWSASEKIVCIVLGYTLFAVAGSLYLSIARWAHGLQKKDKIPGILADILRQAGGVMKVVVIIGIEMIAFPLYCGTMLDIALLSLFEGATLQSRLSFFVEAPFTALFVHWFLGTCYMFHFALFVSMCRKVMRKGVLYFIRDPDDPSYHPVRDVLERPVATQLGKIAFSAFVYGSLLVICLGGVVSGLNRIGDVLPIHWGASDPLMIIPGDILFYNFMLPFILRKIDVPKQLYAVFGWWFKACAAGLRLSDFLFGVDNEDEKKLGAFLWHRFYKVLLHGEPQIKHPMVYYIEKLAKNRERLLWIEARRGIVDQNFVHQIVGPDVKFKIINSLDDKAQALVEFGDDETMDNIKRDIEAEVAKPDSTCRIKHVKDVKVDHNTVRSGLRNTPVDISAGCYVRAPAKDSVRIPKGTGAFLRVDHENVRLDGQAEVDTGLHSKKSDRFSRIYVPNHFRARILTFIGLVWLFIAVAGLMFTIGPLILGRSIVRFMAGPVLINDLYAITVGLHSIAGAIFVAHLLRSRLTKSMGGVTTALKNTRQALPAVMAVFQRFLGLLYVAIMVGLVVPLALSLLAEFYINIPVYTFLVGQEALSGQDTPANALISATQGTTTSPIIHLLQTWAMGILYLRVVLRILTTTPHTNTRPAVAIRGITRNGLLKADVRLASRALILPTLMISWILLGLPVMLTRLALASHSQTLSREQETKLYRYSYPILLSAIGVAYTIRTLRTRIEKWRLTIRDEVYLIGERLHNFPAQEDVKGKREKKNADSRPASSKGKDKGKKKATTTDSAGLVDQSEPVTSDELFDQLGGFEPMPVVPETTQQEVSDLDSVREDETRDEAVLTPTRNANITS